MEGEGDWAAVAAVAEELPEWGTSGGLPVVVE